MNNLFKKDYLSEDVIRMVTKYRENAVGMVAWNEDGSDTIEITEDLILQVIDMLARKNNKDTSEVDNDTSEVNNAISFLKAKNEDSRDKAINNTISYLKSNHNNNKNVDPRTLFSQLQYNTFYKRIANEYVIKQIAQELGKEFPEFTREDLIDVIIALDNVLIEVEHRLDKIGRQFDKLSTDEAKNYFNTIVERIQNIANIYDEYIDDIFNNNLVKYLSAELYGNEYDLPNLLEQLNNKSQELIKNASYIDEVNYDLDDFEQYKLFLEDCKRSLCQEKFMRLWHHIAEKTNSNDINEIAYIGGRELNIPQENIVELYNSMR